MRAVVVTGVSSGIGNATVRALIAKGFVVFGSVRREADAATLAATYGSQFRPLVFDVTDGPAIAAAAATVSRTIGNVCLVGLVNNAGIAIAGPLLHQPMEDVRKQFDVNLFGPMMLVQHFCGLLGSDPARTGAKGRIVNITSAAGKLAGPFLGSYVAAKHAFEGYSDSLRRELMLYGIDVIVVGPGGVATPIAQKAEAEMGSYDDTDYGSSMRAFELALYSQIRAGLPPELIGTAIADILTVSRPKARYAIFKRKLLDWSIPLALPKRTVDRLIAKQFGLMPTKLQNSPEGN